MLPMHTGQPEARLPSEQPPVSSCLADMNANANREGRQRLQVPIKFKAKNDLRRLSRSRPPQLQAKAANAKQAWPALAPAEASCHTGKQQAHHKQAHKKLHINAVQAMQAGSR